MVVLVGFVVMLSVLLVSCLRVVVRLAVCIIAAVVCMRNCCVCVFAELLWPLVCRCSVIICLFVRWFDHHIVVYGCLPRCCRRVRVYLLAELL